QDEQFMQKLSQRLPDWPERTIAEYVALGSAAIWTACDIDRHALIARMLSDAQSETMPLSIHTEHHYEHRVTDMTLVAADQHGLFSKIAGAMSLAGANITGAKIFTLKNGMAVELFQVQDMAADVFDAPDKLAKMSVYIRQVLSGELDLNMAFGKRLREWRWPETAMQPITTQVFVDNEASEQHTVIELTGRDRPGFLYQVTRAIADLGLSISTAHISTYGLQVADVFYVKDQFGMKITHDAKLKTIKETLLETVG
ncbi:MAG: ACT domain-containing protein, partial [Bacteroidota bacterium]